MVLSLHEYFVHILFSGTEVADIYATDSVLLSDALVQDSLGHLSPINYRSFWPSMFHYWLYLLARILLKITFGRMSCAIFDWRFKISKLVLLSIFFRLPFAFFSSFTVSSISSLIFSVSVLVLRLLIPTVPMVLSVCPRNNISKSQIQKWTKRRLFWRVKGFKSLNF